MISRIKKLYSTRIAALVFFITVILTASFVFVGAFLVPSKLTSDTTQYCVKRLRDKAYQTKQLLLENVNNSKRWLENRQSSFFDSRWFAISYYEHDSKEWVLKDYKINDIVLNIYNVPQSEYIKVDQNLIAPSATSEQFNLLRSKIADIPVLVLDIPNAIVTKTSNHLIRVTLFSDQLLVALTSDEQCEMHLLDTKGNILSGIFQIDEERFLEKFQTTRSNYKNTEVDITPLDGKNILSYKVLKNLYVIGIVSPRTGALKAAFYEIGIFNFAIITLMAGLCFAIMWKQFRARISAININIRKVSHKDYKLHFDLSTLDEFSETEEEISRLTDRLRKK